MTEMAKVFGKLASVIGLDAPGGKRRHLHKLPKEISLPSAKEFDL